MFVAVVDNHNLNKNNDDAKKKREQIKGYLFSIDNTIHNHLKVH